MTIFGVIFACLLLFRTAVADHDGDDHNEELEEDVKQEKRFWVPIATWAAGQAAKYGYGKWKKHKGHHKG